MSEQDKGAEGGAGDAGGGAAAAAGAGDGGAAAGAGAAGAADLLGGGDAGAGGGAAGGGGEGGGADLAWLDTYSDKPPAADKKANRDWLKSKGFREPDAVVNGYRELEARLLAGDKLVMPKEGDPPEAFEAFYKATGRPDAPEGYEVKLPEGMEADAELVGKLQQAAFKSGVSKAAFEELAAAFNEHGQALLQGQQDGAVAAKMEGIKELRAEWGDQYDANIGYGKKGMAALELSAEMVTGIESGIGTAETLKLLSRIGKGIGEDALLGEGGGRFTMGLEQAKAELDKMKTDPELSAKILAKDKTLTQRRELLQQVVAQHEAAANARAQG